MYITKNALAPSKCHQRRCSYNTKTDLHWYGNVSVYQGVLPPHVGAWLPDSPLLGNCTPLSVNPILAHPVDSNSRWKKQMSQWLLYIHLSTEMHDTKIGFPLRSQTVLLGSTMCLSPVLVTDTYNRGPDSFSWHWYEK